MKKIIFFILLIIPFIANAQLSTFYDVLVKNLIAVDGKIMIGDSITGSDIRSIDSITFKTTYCVIYIDGIGYPFANHDALDDFVANEHIRWDLTGAEDIHVDRITSSAVTQHEANITHANLSGGHNLTGDINHNTILNNHNLSTDIDLTGLTNYDANEHVDHTAVEIATNSVSGMDGGGTIAATRNLSLDFSRLTNITTVANTDYFSIYAGVNGQRRLSWTNLKAELELEISPSTTFLGLGDSPSTYAGSGDFFVTVNSTPDAVEFTDPSGYGLTNFSDDLTGNKHIDHTIVAINTQHSLTGGGTVASTRTLNLVNDEASPGANQVYSTDALGVRGWQEGSEIYDPTKWYFSNDGDDTKHGHTPDSAKATITELNSLTLQPGDFVLFRSDDRWNVWDDAALVPPNSGSDGNPITFTSYGSGDKPLFTWSKNESEADDWTDNGGNLWSNDDAEFTAQVANMVFNDNSAGYKRATEAAVNDTIGEFWYDYVGDSIVIYCTSNPATYYGGIECVLETDAVTPRYGIVHNAAGQSYLIFDGLEISLSGGSCMWFGVNSFNDIIIQNCDFKWGGGQEAYGQQGFRLGNHIEMYGCSFENFLVKENYFFQGYDGGIEPQLPGTDDSLENHFIYNNLFVDCKYALSFDWRETGNSFVDSLYFNNNVCYTKTGGFGAGQRWGNVDVFEIAQIYVGRDVGDLSSNIEIKNNIIYMDSAQLRSWKDPGAGLSAFITFNIFPLGIQDCFDINNNLYYSSNTLENPLMIGALNYSNKYTLAQWQAVTGSPDPNSLNENPKFVDPVHEDFRVYSTSPTINTGDAIANYIVDRFGISVKDPPNIGAYEVPFKIETKFAADTIDFLDHPDTPNNYTDDSLRILTVNATEDAVQFAEQTAITDHIRHNSGAMIGDSIAGSNIWTVDSITSRGGVMRFYYPDRYYDIRKQTNYAPVTGDTTNWYFSMIGGDDANSGHHPDTAKQTIAELNSLTLTAGDTIFFNSGDEFNDAGIVTGQSGSDGNPIVFTSYGSGTLPIINANNYSNSNLTWEDKGSSRYGASIPLGSLWIKNVSEAGVPLTAMQAATVSGELSDLTGNGQWVQKRTVDSIYVQTTGGVDPSGVDIELGTLHAALNNGENDATHDGFDYLVFENIDFQGGYYAIQNIGSNVIIQNCKVHNCYADGIKIEGGEPTNYDDPNGTYSYVLSDIQLLNNDIYNFGESGIDNTGGYNVTIANNDIHDCVPTRGQLGDPYYTNGILFKNNAVNCIVRNNHIYDMTVMYGAISIGGATWGGINDEADSCQVHHNLIEDVNTVDHYSYTLPRYMIGWSAAKNCSFNNNTLANCHVYDNVHSNGFIYFDKSDGGEVTYLCEDDTIKNNIFYNCATDDNYQLNESGSGDVSGLICDYNLYPSTGTFLFKYSGTTYTGVSQWQGAGFDINAVEGDPLFMGASDFSLQAGSPAINAGVDVGLTEDILGNIIVGLPDIGAYESNYGITNAQWGITGYSGDHEWGPGSAVYDTKLSRTTTSTLTLDSNLVVLGNVQSNDNKVVNVIHYGATGDGSTDDITAINTALTAADGKALYFPAGTYVISADITAAVDNVTIRGDGPQASIIYLEDGANDNMITIGGDGWIIENIGLNGNRDNNTGTCNGLFLEDKINLIVDNCEFQEIEDNPVFIRNVSYNIKVLNCIIHDSGCGVNGYKPDASGVGPNDVLIDGCKFYDITPSSHISTNSDDAVDSPNDWTVNNCNFTGETGYMGVHFQTNSLNMNITNSYFKIGEGTGGNVPACVRYYAGSTGIVSNNTFEGSGTGTESHTNISIWGGNNITIEGNYFTHADSKRGSGISLEAYSGNYDVYDINIIGNRFYNIANAAENQAIDFLATSTYTVSNVNVSSNVFKDDRGASAWCSYAVLNSGATAGTVKNISITDNIMEGMLNGGVYLGPSSDNFNIANNTIIDVPTGVTCDDGDDVMIQGNNFRSCTTPIDINDADMVRTMVIGNNWYGCTNDMNSAAATNPLITDNVDKAGAWFATDDK